MSRRYRNYRRGMSGPAKFFVGVLVIAIVVAVAVLSAKVFAPEWFDATVAKVFL